MHKFLNRIFAVLLAGVFLLILSACGQTNVGDTLPEEAATVTETNTVESPSSTGDVINTLTLSEQAIEEKSRQNISNLDYSDNYILLEINPSFLIRPVQAEDETVYFIEPNNRDAEAISEDIVAEQDSLQSAVEFLLTLCKENGYEDKMASDGVSFTIVQENSRDADDVSDQMIVLAQQLVDTMEAIDLDGVPVYYYGSVVTDGQATVNEYTAAEIAAGYEELVQEYREEAIRQLEDDSEEAIRQLEDDGGNESDNREPVWVTCPYCENGTTTCSQCSGIGTVVCDLCGGTGGETIPEEVMTRTEYSEVCSVCGGTGQVQDAYHDGPGVCGQCQGTGVVSNIVNGTATEYVFHPCNRCDGNGTMQCNACEGSGTEICRYCGGEGGWYE